MSDLNDGEIKVFLSSAHIREWKEELSTIDAKIGEAEAQVKSLMERKKEVYAKLQAAAAFSPEIAEWLRNKDEMEAPDDTALTDAILKLLKARGPGRPLNRDRIRQKLPLHGYAADKLSKNPNYLYIALKRLQDRGLIVEQAGNFAMRTQ